LGKIIKYLIIPAFGKPLNDLSELWNPVQFPYLFVNMWQTVKLALRH